MCGQMLRVLAVLTIAFFAAGAAGGLEIASGHFIREGGRGPWRIVAPWVDKGPALDGTLNDECWAKAQPTGPYLVANTTRPTKEQMTAYVVYTDEALYFAFAAEDRDMMGGASARDNDDVWQSDCSEIYLSPTHSKNTDEWYQFIANLAGARYDATVTGQGRKWNPAAEWEAAGKQYDWGWMLEVKIPFAALDRKTPERGDVWAIRLARENYGHKSPTELSSWTTSGFGFDDVISVGELVFGAVDQAKIEASYKVKDGVLCLTGNAPASVGKLNALIGGRYTYYEPGVSAFHFPYYLPFEDRSPAEGMRVGGWISFGEGILTDGVLGPTAGWPVFQFGNNGFDIVFDLGMEYAIDKVELLAGSPVLMNAALYLKSPGGRYVMTHAVHDLVEFDLKGYRAAPFAEFSDVNASARWVRANVTMANGPYPGLSEVRIWGRPLKSGENLPAQAWRQNGGKVINGDPKEIALPEVSDPRIFPVPQEIEHGKGFFALAKGLTIAIPPQASARMRTTAEVLREELKTGFDIEATIAESRSSPGIELKEDVKALEKPEGYILEAGREGIVVNGRDPAGTFYGCMSLLQSIAWHDGGWAVPCFKVRDWPEKKYRYVLANRRLNPALVRAMARLKYNYFNNWVGQVNMESARQFDEYAKGIVPVADRYFVKLTPGIQFNWAWNPDPEKYVERIPGETLDKLGLGRRNPCPSNPDVWKSYFEVLDTATAHCNSDLVNINCDEMQQLNNGSRWNVCELCRARKLSGQELWAETLKKIGSHLAAQNKRIIMNDSPFWTAGISHAEDKQNDWRKAAELLAKDHFADRLVIYVWHDEVVDRLSKLEYPLILFRNKVPSAENAKSPVWSGYYMNLSDGPFDMAIAAGGAQMCWSPSRLVSGTAEFDAVQEACQPVARELADNITLPSRRPGPKEFFTVDLRGAANLSRRDDEPGGGGRGWVGLGRGMDLRALQPGKRNFRGIPFDIIDEGKNNGRGCVMVQNPGLWDKTLPARVEIPLDRKAASLLFLHTLNERPGQNYVRKAELAGYYLMVYEDNTFAREEIKYNINIANWDGLPTMWGYSPRGKTMKAGTLAWEGQTMAGVTAALYFSEWVNPRPDKKIVKVIFATPFIKRSASPILLAMTGVEPTAKDKGGGGDIRPAGLLDGPKPVGVPLDLTGGRVVSDGIYVAPDGTTFLAPGIRNGANVAGCDSFWSAVACLVYDTNEHVRFETGNEAVTVLFAEPRGLTGVAVTPSFREEQDTNDFRSYPRAYTIEISTDGVSWQALPQQAMHDGELEGPRFIAFPAGQYKAVRFKGGFNSVTFYQPEINKRPDSR